MRIMYKQSPCGSLLEKIGIKNCYFKELLFERDMRNVSKKEHHHTFFEVHIIHSGYQTYEIDGKKHKVQSGNLIIIPPGLKHRVADSDSKTTKISLTFAVDEESAFAPFASKMKNCLSLPLPDRIKDNITCIPEESKNRLLFSTAITEARIFETVILLMRLCGFKEDAQVAKDTSEDVRLSMAKQYIKDNIETNLKLSDIASYCYIGTKQLTRLFKIYENTTPALYIQKQRFNHVEKLLSQTNLSLREISEKMNFSSEYHFNTFFKKAAGTPPGEYRLSIRPR